MGLGGRGHRPVRPPPGPALHGQTSGLLIGLFVDVSAIYTGSHGILVGPGVHGICLHFLGVFILFCGQKEV
jgi:hypothetical protein